MSAASERARALLADGQAVLLGGRSTIDFELLAVLAGEVEALEAQMLGTVVLDRQRTAVVQQAIDEWATIAGGPKPNDVSLARYIASKFHVESTARALGVTQEPNE